MNPSNAREVARISSLSIFACDSDSLSAVNDIDARIEHVKVDSLVSDVGCNSDSLDVGVDINSYIKQNNVTNLISDVGFDKDELKVCDDIISYIEKIKVKDPIDLGPIMPRVPHMTRSLQRDGSVATWPLQDARR